MMLGHYGDLEAAIAIRSSLFGGETTGYRLIAGEGDFVDFDR
ncbi:MAG: hypothetical protein U0930_07435 [Pirellulales bacterium]